MLIRSDERSSDEMVVTNIFLDLENMGVDTRIKLLRVSDDEL